MVLEKVKNIGKGNAGTKYEFFSGKGGVGKTTLSAARALYLSSQGNRVLIISTDPAHSLSDSFETEIEAEETELRENLYAVEISPDKAVSDFEEKVSEEPEMMGGMDLLGGEDMGGIGDMTSMTPGIDEMAAFDKFIEYMHKDDYDFVIFDTAPTGHTLRFLSLPDVMESWLGKLLKIKRKMSQFTGMFKGFMPFTEEEEDGEEESFDALEDLKEKIKDARGIMQDSSKTRFWMLMIPEEMSLYEGERMLDELNKYDIICENIVVNKIIPENSDCEFCSSKRDQQMEVLSSIKGTMEDKDIRTLELHRKEIKGSELLKKVGLKLYE